MRHAKSEHPAGTADRDRPLSPRGRRSAAAVGNAITCLGSHPEEILTSPARRARDTAELAAAAGGWKAPIIEVESLYGAGVGGVLQTLANRSSSRMLAVGHEPTWSETVATLIGGGSVRMVTAAVVCIETPRPVAAGAGALRWMLHPRLLPDPPA